MEKRFETHVISRQIRDSDIIKYYHRNAKGNCFLKTLLNDNYDVISDFMSYNTDEFTNSPNLAKESEQLQSMARKG